MKIVLTIALLVAVAGCHKIETPANYPARPDSSMAADLGAVEEAAASKVAAVMAANGITVSDVAAFLGSRGWTIVQANLPKPHWKAATGAAYYVCDIRVACGDTALAMYFPQTAGPYCVQVKGVDAAGVSGPWSLVGWSDNGNGANSLPGVRP